MSDVPEKPAAAPETPEPKRRFRFGCLGLCVCVFLLFILTWVGVKLGMGRALDTAKADLRAAGEPLTWEEVLAAIEPIPDAENSALVLQPHLASLSIWGGKPAGEVVVKRLNADIGVRRSDEMAKLMRICLTDNRVVLDALHKAAECPSGRWPLDSDPFVYNHGLEYVASIRSAARLLDVEAELRATEGDGHAAALSVRVLRRLAASLDGSPYLIGALVRFAVDGLSVDAAEGALGLTELPAEDLAMLRDEFAAEAQQLSLRVAARAERAGLLWLTTECRQMLAGEIGAPKIVFMLYSIIPGITETDAIFGLKHMTELVELLKLPPRELLAAAELHSAKCERATEGWKAGVLHTMSSLVMPGLGQASKALVRAKLQLHVARTALAVEQFRLERGRWPEKLTDLVPDYLDAVPQDWFALAGTAISYARTPAGARVWSRYGDNLLGLTEDDEDLKGLALSIFGFFENEDRLPKSLDEMLEDYRVSIPTDPCTGKPFTYVTNPASPNLFILGGFTGGMSETEFWKQALSTDDWVARHVSPRRAVVFRLLNLELRAARQARFADEVDAVDRAAELHDLGYTPERLKELGFSDSDVNDYRGEIEIIEEEKAERAPQHSSTSDVPPDTPAEPAP